MRRMLGIVIAVVCALLAPRASADEKQERRFILRVKGKALEEICKRNSLRLVRSVGTAKDHGVFLVSGSANFSTSALQETEPEVEGIERVRDAVVPEVTGASPLQQSTAAFLDGASRPRYVDYHGAYVWQRYVDQAAATLIRLSEAHRQFATGSGIVAVIDTGIDPNHPGLAPAIASGWDFVNEAEGVPSELADLDQSTAAFLDQSTAAFLDQKVVTLNQSTAAFLDQSTAAFLDTQAALPAAFGHGTMVAGLVRLVAPNAKIMPLKAFKADGTASVFDIVRAIYYAVENGAKVINMSFSLPVFSPELMKAVNYATREGVICVASVGNSGQQTLVFPAALGNVLGVASTSGKDLRSPFSNFGADLVTLSAPGESLITTYPGGRYATVSGTSFSTALVAGAAALLLDVDSKTTFYQALEALSHAKSVSPDLGRGRLDAYEALEYAQKRRRNDDH